MRVFAVMPAFHEEGRVQKAIEAVSPFVERVIVVDDGSSDATFTEASQTQATVLRHRINRGQGAALRTGTRAALALGADIIVHIDADGQHDASFIPSLIQPIQEGKIDVTFGSRFLGLEAQGMPFSRRLLLMVGGRVLNTYILGVSHKITDPQSGLRAMNREAASKIGFVQDGMAHCSEILRLVTHSDLRWQEVPIKVIYTAETLAKGQKPSNALRIVWSLLWGAFRK